MTINEVEDYKSGIYEIRNLVTGKKYIGSAVNIRTRWNGHRYCLRKGTHHSAKLQNSWNKHGEESFEFSRVERVDNPEHLVLIEQVWLDWTRVATEGYNMAPVAGATRGYKFSEAQRAKMSEDRKARNWKPTKEMLELATLGRKAVGYTSPTQEVKDKIAESLRGRPRGVRTEEHRRNLSVALKGKGKGVKRPPKSLETREKLSKARIGIPRSEEVKQKMREGWARRKAALAEQARIQAEQELEEKML